MVILLGLGALAVIGLLAWGGRDSNTVREIWLINGARYALAFRTNSPGWDSSLFPGFCEFSSPVVNPGDGYYEVQFTAQWCTVNTLWQVPENIAVSQV